MIIPDIIKTCVGIKISGQILRSFLFTTDVAIIRNTNADAIIAVYPFSPQSLITQSLILASDKPMLCGIGGGGKCDRLIRLATDAEVQGALGVVLNLPTSSEMIIELKKSIAIPLVLTIITEKEDIKSRIQAGADILNVSVADKTAEMVRMIRSIDPNIPVIATGGKSEDTIKEVIEAGANAVSFTPPSTGELFKEMMTKFRNREE
jgi:hypothetical protein